MYFMYVKYTTIYFKLLIIFDSVVQIEDFFTTISNLSLLDTLILWP